MRPAGTYPPHRATAIARPRLRHRRTGVPSRRPPRRRRSPCPTPVLATRSTPTTSPPAGSPTRPATACTARSSTARPRRSSTARRRPGHRPARRRADLHRRLHPAAPRRCWRAAPTSPSRRGSAGTAPPRRGSGSTRSARTPAATCSPRRTTATAGCAPRSPRRSPGAEAQVTGYAALPANAWKTLTVTLDTTARRVTTYLDGAAVASAPTTVSAGDLHRRRDHLGRLHRPLVLPRPAVRRRGRRLPRLRARR